MEPLRQLLTQEFYESLDGNLKLFAREIRREQRGEGHVIIAITGYPGVGKSTVAAIIGALIDSKYSFDKNICFIPSAKEIEQMYFSLPMYSVFHIDEASRGLHKHKWYDTIQQKINTLYDTEREGHFLCTVLIMPRFQNFTENFRNFMIKYWVNIPQKGLAIFYKKDEDKDVKDPWHLDENYKKKQKKWRGRRVFERTLPEVVRIEQGTDNYWFYCKTPEIPNEVWSEYQKLKSNSRVEAKKEEEVPDELTNRKEERNRDRIAKWKRALELRNQGKSTVEIALIMQVTPSTVRTWIVDAKTLMGVKGATPEKLPSTNDTIFNQIGNDENLQTKRRSDKVLFVTQQNEAIEEELGK